MKPIKRGTDEINPLGVFLLFDFVTVLQRLGG
jgi:hypothetical protein